jgi:SPOR domain
MADRTQLRVADREGLSNDDPFAELTRIMGFDPREPARQPEQSLADNILGDDFGIDLEKELMGEFGEFVEQGGEVVAYTPAEQRYASSQPAEPAFEEAAYETEAAYQPAYEAEASYEPASEAGTAYGAAYEAESVYQPAYEAEAAHESAYAPEPTYQPAYEADATYEPASEAGAAYGTAYEAEPDSQPAYAPEYEQAAQYEPAAYAAQEPVADAFDQALASSLEDEFAIHGDWQPAEAIAQADETVPAYDHVAYAEPVAAQPADAVAYAADEDFVAEFDVALAEVDMDFTAAPLVSAGGPTFEPQVDLDAELEHRLQHESMPETFAEPELAAPSLEDELNALLGNMSPSHAVANEPVAVAEPVVADDEQVAYHEQEPAYYEQQSAAHYEQPAQYEPEFEVADVAPVASYQDATPTYQEEVAATDEFDLGLTDEDFLTEAPTAPADEPFYASARSDYSYSRGNFRVQSAEDFYSAPVAAYEAPAEDEEPAIEPVDYAPEPEFVPAAEAEVEPDFDLSFDDDDFDAAFAKSIEEPAAFVAEADGAEQPKAEAAEEEDPYAELAALTQSFASTASAAPSWNPDAAPAAEQQHPQYEQMSYDRTQHATSGFDDYPDIETVDVPEQAVALADDLDLPELTFEEDVPTAAAYDDIDAEFASLLNDMNSPEPAAPEPAKPAAAPADDFAADFEREFQLEDPTYQSGSYAYPAAAAAGAVATAAAFGAAAPRSAYAQPVSTASTAGDVFGSAAHGQQAGFEYDSDLDDEMSLPAYGEAEEARRPQRRGVLIAAIIGGVVVLGGVGAFALSRGGVGSGAPAIIKADEGPVKVRPENPGGTTVANQDNKVYETVARTPSNEPTQQKLVTTAETPVDMTAQEAPLDEEETIVGTDESSPMGKSEDRIQQAIQDDAGPAQNAEVAAVAPRKVRTMVVRADGTLVPREDPAPALAPAVAAKPAPAAATPAAAVEPVPAEAATAPKPASKPQPSATPASVAVAPSRPSDQPVDVVGEVKPDKVAALSANAGAAGEWAMQIASQPSEAAAQSSYQDLLRKYGNVLNGHPANVVKAEIAGKGTFWRVRVPAPTRNDAIALCESYKAAGGSCFVSK